MVHPVKPSASVTIRDVAGRAGVSAGTVSRALNGVGGLSAALRDRVQRAADELGYDRASLRLAARPRVSLADIAAREGVSVGSVSRALRSVGGVSPETRERVLRAAEELGYDLGNLHPAPITRLGVLIHRGDNALSNNLFYSAVLHGAEIACRTHKLAMTYTTAGPGDDLSALVVEQQIDGLLCVGYFEDELLSDLRATGKPLVLVDHFAPGLPSVNSDNFGGAYAATAHLLKLGRTRVAFLSGQREHYSIAERRRGYQAALADAGVTYEPELDVTRQPPELESGTGAAMQALLALPQPPNAVFAFNDATAALAMAACQEAGLNVPRDVSFAGFDDVQTAAHFRPPLTTVRVDREALGARGLELLMSVQEGAAAQMVPTRLIVRESSVGAAPGPTLTARTTPAPRRRRVEST
ncbi:LacI family DNA-binding transcriptional regulator [Deinococcus rubellus]|uniref:Substrate-binding domain-containing protein n=1 Tax=Deinococcus rubellus TaxID=1889240 RepID=A0ABY5YGD5_9DEIO|nr:substrate-binding domain-containing protein [Deinococcus rubellus]UWX64113.1 substrate-binding domain-containing protein [Deinococcus rubellus]